MFNQFGDLECCALRAGNVHSADGWDVLKPVVARYQGRVSRIYFRADAAFAMPEVYEFLEAGAPVACQFQLSGRNLDQAAEGYRQGRVASRRTLSPRRLHRDEHEPPGRARRCFLQQARDVRAMDQGGQRRDQVDATVGTFAANAVRLQLHALAYNLGNFLRTLATPEPIKDWSLTSLKDKLIKIGAKVVSHGRYVVFQMAEVAIARQMFQEILRLITELRPQPPPAPA